MSDSSLVAEDTVLVRLEAMAARLEAQSALIEQQGREIAALRAAAASPASAPVARDTDVLPATLAPAAAPKLGRRNWLGKVAGATAAAAVLAVATEPQAALASTRTTVIPGSVSSGTYGLAASVSSTDPSVVLGNLTTFGHAFGIVGAESNPGFAPPNGAGVLGQAVGFDGVIGLSNAAVGVYGQSLGGSGVQGQSNSSVGVFGLSPVWGVVGRGTGIGVFGVSDSPSNAPKEGVRGESVHGPGVFGKSTNHAGVYSQGGGGNIALFGITATGTALAAQATGGGQAGLFLGNVNIIGNLTVSGSFPKSAGVPHPDGSVRRMYCMEAPESVFEDVGRGHLQGGKADIKLDPEFAALVTADDYNVFLQPEGPTTLYVSQRTATGFEVREVEDGAQAAPGTPGHERSVRPVTAGSTVSFSYRVLAKRKDLVGNTKRMERIDLPRGVRRGGDRGVAADENLLPVPPERTRTSDEPALDAKPRGAER